MALYTTKCIHIDANSTIQGTVAVRDWFSNLLNNKLKGATFTLGTVSGTGTNRSFTWTAKSTTAKVVDGSDTFGLAGGEIAYHYSFFNVTA